MTAAVRTWSDLVGCAWRLPTRGRVVEFAEDRHRIVLGGMRGPWRRDAVRWQAHALEWLGDPRIHQIVLILPAQSGKTTFTLIACHYYTAVEGAPILLVAPDELTLSEIWNKKLKPSILGSESWNALRPVDQKRTLKSGELKEALFSNGSTITGAIASSNSQMSSKSVKLVVLDEFDLMPDSPLEGPILKMARARVTSYPTDWKIVVPTTPRGTPDTSRGWQLYKSSTQHELQVQCPECREWAPWSLSRVCWEERPGAVTLEDWADRIERGEVEVWASCPHCDARIPEEMQEQLNENDRCVALRPDARTYGLHFTGLSTRFTTLRQCAADWLRARAAEDRGDDGPMRAFYQLVLARPYSRPRSRIVAEQVVARQGTVPRGTVPAGAQFLAAAIDVQRNGFWWGVKAYRRTPDPCEWWVDCGFSELSVGEGVLWLSTERWALEGEERAVTVGALGVDTGDGLMLREIMQAVAPLAASRAPRVLPVKGASTHLAAGYAVLQKEDKTWKTRLLLVDTVRLKDRLQGLMEPGKPGLVFYSGVEADEVLQAHLTSEHRVVSAGKRRTASWEPVRAGRPNHLLDVGVYCDALAALAGVFKAPAAAGGRNQRRVRGRQPRGRG